MPVYSSNQRQTGNKRKKRGPFKPLIVILAAVAVIFGLMLMFYGLLKSNSDIEETAVNIAEDIFGFKNDGPPYTIAIDPGHGGKDVGAQGLIDEVELTEKTAAKLYSLLESNPDFKPVLCRNYGEGATPTERAKAANKANAHLMLSIHGNSDQGEGSYGFECFPAPPGRKWHNESKLFAELLTQEIQSAGGRLRGQTGVRYVYYNENDEKFFVESTDITEYDYPSFSVVDKADCVSLLAEQCFVNNEADMQLFGTDEGCQRAAECYYNAIIKYFSIQQ